MEQFQWLLFSYVLVESTKLRGLRDNVGCVDPWVRGLRGSNFYVGCVGYVGQNIFYVGCVGPNFFCVGLCVVQNFSRGSKIFALVKFYLLDVIILRD